MSLTAKDLTVKKVEFGSDSYLAAVELRRRVLRFPLGLDFTPEQLASDSGCHHFAALLNGEVVGTLIVNVEDPDIARIRQVAVDPELQGSGVGAKLMLFAESWSLESRLSRAVLHSRATVVGFYSKLGYSKEGDIFNEIGIPHQKMVKTL